MNSDSSAKLSPRAAKGAKRKSAKIRELKPRQKKLLHGIVVEKKSVRAAALDAGYSPMSAQHPSELLSTAAMREALARLLPSPEKIAQRITEGMDAMETKFFQFEGCVSDSRDVIAWSERRMYTDLAAELKGLKSNQKLEFSGDVNFVKVEFTNVAACAEP